MKRVFYDGKNPFCNHIAKLIGKLDRKRQFKISSLDGQTAKTLFKGNYGFLRQKKSIVFVEGERVWVRSNALFRLFWLLGGNWKILGSLYVIPGFIFNPIFRLLTIVVWK